MFISIAFLLTDVIVTAARITKDSGINPWWRFALVFKCASDTIFLDDFKVVLDEIIARSFSGSGGRAMHRGSGLNQRSERRKSLLRSGTNFIECSSVPTAPPKRSQSKSQYLNPFARHERIRSRSVDSAHIEMPGIRVQQETSVTMEPREANRYSYGSERTMVPKTDALMMIPRKGDAENDDTSKKSYEFSKADPDR
jgi:hypothetical protein